MVFITGEHWLYMKIAVSTAVVNKSLKGVDLKNPGCCGRAVRAPAAPHGLGKKHQGGGVSLVMVHRHGPKTPASRKLCMVEVVYRRTMPGPRTMRSE